MLLLILFVIVIITLLVIYENFNSIKRTKYYPIEKISKKVCEDYKLFLYDNVKLGNLSPEAANQYIYLGGCGDVLANNNK